MGVGAVREYDLLGRDYLNRFLLLEIGGERLIVAKAYDSVGE